MGRWEPFRRNLPVVAVRDIIVHPRDPDVIIGTHGRGIWIMDDIGALQQLSPAVRSADAHLFGNEIATTVPRRKRPRLARPAGAGAVALEASPDPAASLGAQLVAAAAAVVAAARRRSRARIASR